MNQMHNKCTLESVLRRAPWLTIRLAKKKVRIVQNAVAASNRGDRRCYMKWASINAKFDCRNQPAGFGFDYEAWKLIKY